MRPVAVSVAGVVMTAMTVPNPTPCASLQCRASDGRCDSGQPTGGGIARRARTAGSGRHRVGGELEPDPEPAGSAAQPGRAEPRAHAVRANVEAHLDLFRVSELAAEDPELLADYLGPDTIAFVEWPPGDQRWVEAFARIAARVRIQHAGGDRRIVELG
jgi:hypothetical protein